ncbi:hypothetical protein HanHA300_Chr03g0083741 [Helianthus annuus]|nr:hypothetical protein HanHA300_Chr03g0083741 [Helianthus annuus]KAJ0607314.1 hypothetical protein HanHA89_Chr03g0095251 [Helianthus annuus]KAJ0767373.1 hypothetical protein HanLR1_Chr03g0088541 [Helianthus annuus]
MNHKDHSTIHSVVTQDDLQSFISAYCIPSSLSPHFPGPSESATCSSKHTVHPLAFLRIVHFELTCAAFDGAPSLPFFRRFYRLKVCDICASTTIIQIQIQ